MNTFNINYNKLFPNGKLQERLLVIKKSGSINDIIKVPLHIDGDISLKFSSSFSSIYNSEPNTLMTLISGGFDIPLSGQFAAQGAQIWKSTEPLEISVEVSLMMNNSGKEDVVKPALELAKLCLPKTSDADEDTLFGTISKKLKCLIPPGPNIQAILNTTAETGFSNEQGVYDVQIGWITLKNCIIKESTPTFSNIVDEDGFPISATISLTISTVMIPTVQSVNNIINSLSENIVDSTPISKLYKIIKK